MPKDSLALTLNGTTQWPDEKALRRLGETRMHGTPSEIRHIFEHISEAMAQTEIDLRSYMQDHSEFEAVGREMLKQWANARQLSLQTA